MNSRPVPVRSGGTIDRWELKPGSLSAGTAPSVRHLSFWVIVNVVGAPTHLRLVRELTRGGSAFNRPSRLAIGVALILAVGGRGLAIYLIVIREPEQEPYRERWEKIDDRKSKERIGNDTQPPFS